jgi:hypothetical protein
MQENAPVGAAGIGHRDRNRSHILVRGDKNVFTGPTGPLACTTHLQVNGKEQLAG